MTPSRKRRAPKGGVEARLLLKLPAALAKMAKQTARMEGMSVSEWWRQAARDRISYVAATLDLSGPAPQKKAPSP